MRAILMSVWLYRLIRWAVGLIFLYSGLTKLLDPESFEVIIGAYGLVPECLITYVALLLSIMEITAGLGLLLDVRGSLSVVTFLIVLFMMILGYGIHMGLHIDCGCFGPDDPKAQAFHGLHIALCRDVVIFLGICFLYGWRILSAYKPLSIINIFENTIRQRS